MPLNPGQSPVNELTPDDRSRGGSSLSPLKVLANAVRNRRWCGPQCPFADACPMLPLSMHKDNIVISGGKEKHPCKLKEAPPGVQRRIQNMFLNGEDGLLLEIKSALFVAGQNLGPDVKERLSYADAMMRLHKTMYGEKSNVNTTQPLDITVRQLVVQPDGTKQAQEVKLNQTEAQDYIRQTNAAKLLARNDPPPEDPESLIASPVLDVILSKPKPEDIISYDMSDADEQS